MRQPGESAHCRLTATSLATLTPTCTATETAIAIGLAKLAAKAATLMTVKKGDACTKLVTIRYVGGTQPTLMAVSKSCKNCRNVDWSIPQSASAGA